MCEHDPVSCLFALDQVAPFLTYNEEANHFPIVWFNDFWLLRDYLVPMNDTLTNVTLHFDLGYASLTW